MLFSFCKRNEIAAVNFVITLEIEQKFRVVRVFSVFQSLFLPPFAENSSFGLRQFRSVAVQRLQNDENIAITRTLLLDFKPKQIRNSDGHLSLIVIRSSDYVFANSTQIRGSIPGEDDFVMRGKLDSAGNEKKGGKFRDGIYDLKGGCGIMGTVR